MARATFGEDPLKRLILRLVNCKEGEGETGDEVQFVVFDVPVHPLEPERDTRMCERMYHTFEPFRT